MKCHAGAGHEASWPRGPHGYLCDPCWKATKALAERFVGRALVVPVEWERP